MSEQVSILYLPSKSQQAMWWRYITESDGIDEDGYWLGHCPIHDDEQDPETASAQFNFRKGVMRCLGEPCCHGERRCMSLTNVTIRMMKGGEDGSGQR